MASYTYVTLAVIFVITSSPFHVNSLAIDQTMENVTASRNNLTSSQTNLTLSLNNMTLSDTNMTLSMTNDTEQNCTIVVQERPKAVEVKLTELANQTEENFINVQEGLANVLDQVLTNFTESVNKVYTDNNLLMERLNDLEASFNEVKAEKLATEQTLQGIYMEELSCEYIRDNVSASMTPKSGLYWLRDKYGRRYVTYCDFDAEGRSWTLVASVHENKMGLDGRCSAGDKWSSELGWKDADPNGDTAWSDLSTFGDVTTATSGDYKNPGYFSAKAKNVMIWHVKENTPIEEIKENAYLRYRTTNNVLHSHGGNMYTLYNNHYPHKPGTSFPNHGPSAPVTYDKGSWTEHSYHLGTHVKSRVIGGQIQFRAVTRSRQSFALCPGGAIQRHSSEYYNFAQYFCLGSNPKPTDSRYCGDFGWWDRDGYGRGIGYSADQILVKTAFLIFYY